MRSGDYACCLPRDYYDHDHYESCSREYNYRYREPADANIYGFSSLDDCSPWPDREHDGYRLHYQLDDCSDANVSSTRLP